MTTKREFRPYETTPPEGDNLLVKNPEMPAYDNGAENNETTAATDTTAMVGNMASTDSINGTVTPENASEQADTTTTAKVADTFRNSKAKQESAAATAKKITRNRQHRRNRKTRTPKMPPPRPIPCDAAKACIKSQNATAQPSRSFSDSSNLKNDKLQIGDKIRVK